MYWQKRLNNPNSDEEIENLIQEISVENNRNYGYRRVTMKLRKRGYIINHKKVLRIMNKLDLTCKKFTRKSRKYNSYKGKVGTIAPNRVNRRFNTSIPLQKITTDTTECKYYTKDQSGKVLIRKAYLDPYLDMFNGEILSFHLSRKPNAEAVLNGLKEVIELVKNAPYRTTIHTDQGWAYQMNAFSKELKNHRIFQSMSRRGNCLDNSPMENFFGIMKQEMYYGVVYESFEALEYAVKEYISYYNNQRIKEKLTGMSPIEYRKQTSRECKLNCVSRSAYGSCFAVQFFYCKIKYNDWEVILLAKSKRDQKSAELAKQILENYQPETVEDMQDALKDIFGPMFETMLKGEMNHHLGYESNDKREKETDNRRNGYGKKTVKTSSGTLDIDVPRDRDAS